MRPANRPGLPLIRSRLAKNWLVEKIEHTQLHFSWKISAESLKGQPRPPGVLIGALKVLGLNGTAQSFMPRLARLSETASDT